MSRNITRGLAAIVIGAVLVAAAGTSVVSAALPSPLTVVVQHEACFANGSARATLTFNNPTRFAFAWEYRVDGQLADGRGFWPGVRTGVYNGVDYGAQQSVTLTYTTLDYRLKYGAESDWFYDWQRVTNPCVPLTNKAQCRNGGWATFIDVASQTACTKGLRV